MIVVLAGSTLVDYFFLGKYRVLLMANQEGYVVALIQSAGTVANMVVSIGLIYAGASVLAVKAVATGVYVLRLFLVKAYAKKKYPDLNFHARPAEGALKQKMQLFFIRLLPLLSIIRIRRSLQSALAAGPFLKSVYMEYICLWSMR